MARRHKDCEGGCFESLGRLFSAGVGRIRRKCVRLRVFFPEHVKQLYREAHMGDIKKLNNSDAFCEEIEFDALHIIRDLQNSRES